MLRRKEILRKQDRELAGRISLVKRRLELRMSVWKARTAVIEEAVALYQDGVGGSLPMRLRKAVHDLGIARLGAVGKAASQAEARRKKSHANNLG